MMYSGIVLAIFILLDICQISWMCLYIYSFHQVWSIFGHYFLRYFSCPPPILSFPSGTSITQILGHEAVPPLSNSVFKKILTFLWVSF